MITREEMENYLCKGGYHEKDTGVGSIRVWQYKESDMFCNVGDICASFWEYPSGNMTRDIDYEEWSIDPSCGCLVQQ